MNGKTYYITLSIMSFVAFAFMVYHIRIVNDNIYQTELNTKSIKELTEIVKSNTKSIQELTTIAKANSSSIDKLTIIASSSAIKIETLLEISKKLDALILSHKKK